MDSNVTDNKVTVDLQGKNIYVISEKYIGLLSNDFQTGKTSIILNADDVVNIKAGKMEFMLLMAEIKAMLLSALMQAKKLILQGSKMLSMLVLTLW